MTNPNQAGIIIVAAGESRRMGIDKTFMPIGNKPLLAWSVDACQRCSAIDRIVLVLNRKNIDQGKKLAKDQSWSKVAAICPGGQRRQDSVDEGLRKLHGCRWVLIHDGSRPFLTDALIRDGLAEAQETGAAIAAVPVKDTIKRARTDMIVESTLERQLLWAVQTPQVFRSDIITEAYSTITDDVTDDASLVEKLGIRVKIYMGSYNNIKVTTSEDAAMAESLAAERRSYEGRDRL